MSSYSNAVQEQQQRFMEEFRTTDLPENLIDTINHVTYEAAEMHVSAGFSGSWSDGGARSEVDKLKKFVRGFRCGRAAIAPEELISYYYGDH